MKNCPVISRLKHKRNIYIKQVAMPLSMVQQELDTNTKEGDGDEVR